MVDGTYALKKKLKISVSRNHLINCSYGFTPTKSIYGTDGCDGGDPAIALSYVAASGLTSESLYPYTYENKHMESGPVSLF